MLNVINEDGQYTINYFQLLHRKLSLLRRTGCRFIIDFVKLSY